MVAVSLISKRYKFTLIPKDTYDALTEDEREQVVGDLWKKAKERLDRQIEEEEERHRQYPEPLLEEWLSSVESARDTKTVDHYRLDLQRFLHVAPPRTGQLQSPRTFLRSPPQSRPVGFINQFISSFCACIR